MKNLLPGWARQQFEPGYVRVNGKSVAYLHGGEGPPLLMIHGLSASLDWWQFNAPVLADRFRVYLIDLPGFGRLGDFPSPETMAEFAQWLLNVIAALEIDRPHLMGLSMGANIALNAAVQSPERVGRLVLVTPSLLLPEKSLLYHALIGLGVLREIPRSLIPLAVRDARWADLKSNWQSSQDLIAVDVWPLLPRVRARTLVVASNNDPVLPMRQASEFTSQISDARLIVFPGAGHLVMLSDPERLNREVTKFLEEN
jgi:pimeloyl-ACP methyl ester carboxylesterase